MRMVFTLIAALVLGACENTAPTDVLQGYVEGHQLNLAPRATGIIERLHVAEGDTVDAGTVLFTLDNERAQALLEETKAATAASEARLADLKKGGRPEEIRAAKETLAEAQASLTLAEQTYQRSKNLVESDAVAMTRLDQDRANLDASRARFTGAQSRLALIRLPARTDQIIAAEQDVTARRTAILRAQADLTDRTTLSPAAGRIETLYRRVGEIAGPSQPVLALLPTDQKYIRFFVPEPMLALVQHGNKVTFVCDNCPAGLHGEITYIADQAEFTPPVIFTEKERVKLVYMIEARPDKPSAFLVGQPVGVLLQ